MWRTVAVLWCLVLQGLTAQDIHTIPPLDKDNGIELTGNNDNSLALVLKRLDQLETENRQLREDLQQSNSQLQALQAETSQIRQQVNATAGMGSEVMTYVSNTMTTSMEENSEMLQTQLSQLTGFVEEVKSQQGLVLQQTEVMQSVFDVVQEFEDEAANVTTRINDLDNRLSSAEATLLQTQVEGCGCPDQSRVLQRLDDLETAVKELRKGPSVVSSTPPTPPPRSTPESTFSTYESTGTSTDHPVTTGRVLQLEFAVPAHTLSYNDYLITGVLATKGGKLLTTDRQSLEMRMASLDRPEVAEDTINLEYIPWAMLELHDGNVALTYETATKIDIFNINGNDLELVKTIETERSYGGIAPGPGNDTLIVSKWRRGEIARLYIISMEGNVERTLLEDKDFMIDPFCLKRFGDDVYVSDWTSGRLYLVNVYTGEASSSIGSLDLSSLSLSQPRQFDFDDSGNLYLATGGRVCNEHADGYFCIIQVTQSGTWRVMEDYTSINGGGYPYGVGVTSRQIVISWGKWYHAWTSELTSYELPPAEEFTEIVPTSTIGRTGSTYVTRPDSDGCPTDNSTCMDSNGLVCSGQGECICGMCSCHTLSPDSASLYSGQLCQCNDYSCPRGGDDWTLCGGPTHGRCDCGMCQCLEGWEGDACDCSTDTSTCMASNGLVCNGHGTCECGRCRCDASSNHMGPTCEECPTCTNQCSYYRSCVQCMVFGTGPYDGDQCVELCPNIFMLDHLDEENERITRCEFRDADGCLIRFTYEYDPDRYNDVSMILKRGKEC